MSISGDFNDSGVPQTQTINELAEQYDLPALKIIYAERREEVLIATIGINSDPWDLQDETFMIVFSYHDDIDWQDEKRKGFSFNLVRESTGESYLSTVHVEDKDGEGFTDILGHIYMPEEPPEGTYVDQVAIMQGFIRQVYAQAGDAEVRDLPPPPKRTLH
ncbi:MAG: hypothetical protein H6867_07255 [Rhodospirillales bacterium]|nr:hypothetical protein [Rhodospirillales bacterium]MCB9995348.1 hypothetical protein [Rhodospirillales bacterium]